jgi:arsenate reductase
MLKNSVSAIIRFFSWTLDPDKTIASPSMGGPFLRHLSDRELDRFRTAQAAGIKTVLFVCSGNAIRSQIAEALVNDLLKGKWAAFSAGIMPMDIPKDVSVVMNEIGIDMSGHHSKHVDVFGACRFDRVAIICSDVDRLCPNLPDAHVTDHMSFNDPLSSAHLSEGAVFSLRSALRSLRDEIRHYLTAYFKNA